MNCRQLRLSFVIMLTFISMSLFSQNMLLVRKYGEKKNMKYYVGSHIKFSYFDRAGEVNKISGVINVINKETIIINYDQEFELANIKTVFVERRGVKLAQTVGTIAGAGYLALTGINNLISDNNQISTAEYVAAGSVVAVSLGVTPLNKKKYHLYKKEKYTWEVLTP